MRSCLNPSDWPALPFAEWEKTCDTLHMWTQIVGKTRMVLTPLENHWWNVPLYVTPRGLSTSAIPWKHGSFSMEFDLIAHQLLFHGSGGVQHCMRLYPRSVADFYAEYMASLKSLGIEVRIYKVPVEFDDVTPFDQDRHHASYDTGQVERFRRILIHADRIFKQFRTRFLGKCSPVHFYWGSFDLAVSRFSGRRAPERPGADSITREAYSHEVISAGFWPGTGETDATFYAYAAPEPQGFSKASVVPAPTFYSAQLSEFLLPYEDVRKASSPRDMLLDFLQSTYEAGATLGNWDRKEIERVPPPARSPGSTGTGKQAISASE